MIVDVKPIKPFVMKSLGLGIVCPQAQACMAGKSYVLAYDEYVAPGIEQDGAASSRVRDGAWHHVEIHMVKMSAGLMKKIYVDGRLTLSTVIPPKDHAWFSRFVFPYLKKGKIVDNISVRAVTRKKRDPAAGL